HRLRGQGRSRDRASAGHQEAGQGREQGRDPQESGREPQVGPGQAGRRALRCTGLIAGPPFTTAPLPLKGAAPSSYLPNAHFNYCPGSPTSTSARALTSTAALGSLTDFPAPNAALHDPQDPER